MFPVAHTLRPRSASDTDADTDSDPVEGLVQRFPNPQPPSEGVPSNSSGVPRISRDATAEEAFDRSRPIPGTPAAGASRWADRPRGPDWSAGSAMRTTGRRSG